MARKLVAFAVVATIACAPAVLRSPAHAEAILPELSPPPASARFT